MKINLREPLRPDEEWYMDKIKELLTDSNLIYTKTEFASAKIAYYFLLDRQTILDNQEPLDKYLGTYEV